MRIDLHVHTNASDGLFAPAEVVRKGREAGLSTPIFLDPDFKVSTEFGMYGTPSAVLVDEGGALLLTPSAGSISPGVR